MIQIAGFPHYNGFGQKRLPIGPRLFKDNLRQFAQKVFESDLSNITSTSLLTHKDWFIILGISMYGLV